MIESHIYIYHITELIPVSAMVDFSMIFKKINNAKRKQGFYI
jgi:hypothetical protein